MEAEDGAHFSGLRTEIVLVDVEIAARHLHRPFVQVHRIEELAVFSLELAYPGVELRIIEGCRQSFGSDNSG